MSIKANAYYYSKISISTDIDYLDFSVDDAELFADVIAKANPISML